MNELKIGSRVTTSQFGVGEVVKRDTRGVVVRLADFGNLEIYVKNEDVAPTELDAPDSFPADPPVQSLDEWQTDESIVEPDSGDEEVAAATHHSNGRDRQATDSSRYWIRTASEPDSPSLAPSDTSSIAKDLVLRTSTFEEPGHARLRRSVDALRFGLVPEEAILLITVNSQRLQTWSRSRFPTDSEFVPVASAVIGQYGTGKSHTMSVVRTTAKRDNFVVADVQLDGKKVSLQSLPDLAYQIFRTVQANNLDQSTPIADLYRNALDRRANAPVVVKVGTDRTADNFQFAAALQKLGALERNVSTLEILLSGSRDLTATAVKRELVLDAPMLRYQGLTPRPLVSSKVVERPASFVESLAGLALITKRAGYNGLVVTIDELEVESQATRAAKLNIALALETMANYFAGALHVQAAPLSIFFGSVIDDEDPSFRSACAMAGSEGDGIFELQPLSRDDREELAERIFDLYRGAYEFDGAYDSAVFDSVDASVNTSLGADQSLVRSFIKRYVAALDRQFGPPA